MQILVGPDFGKKYLQMYSVEHRIGNPCGVYYIFHDSSIELIRGRFLLIVKRGKKSKRPLWGLAL